MLNNTHNTTQHNTTQHNTTQHNTTQHVDYVGQRLFVKHFKRFLVIFNVKKRIFYAQKDISDTVRKAVA